MLLQVMEAICIMMGFKPESKMDAGTGKRVNDYWPPSQKLLGDMKFIDNLKKYDKNNIPDATMTTIRNKYTNVCSTFELLLIEVSLFQVHEGS